VQQAVQHLDMSGCCIFSNFLYIFNCSVFSVGFVVDCHRFVVIVNYAAISTEQTVATRSLS